MKTFLATLYRLGYPLALVYWFIFRPTTEGVRCIVSHKDNILVIKHTYGPQFYTVPGGGIEPNESVQAAATRETLEETGIAIEQVELLDTILHTKEFKKDTVHICTAKASNPKLVIDATEIAAAAWYTTDNLPENLSPILKPYVTTFGVESEHS